MKTSTQTQIDLKTAWQNLLGETPKLRIRDAAEILGVSETELLATKCGETVTRLAADWGTILTELNQLGRVMAITRNHEVVHERKGFYSKVELMPTHGNMGQVLDEGIDLRLFMNTWHFGFAVAEEKRKSLQFFGSDGTAVHKVYLIEESDETAFQKLVEKYRSANQEQTQTVTAKPARPAEKPDAEINIAAFRSRWAALKDTHEFFQLTREFGVAREQALRLADRDAAFAVEKTSYRTILETVARDQMNIMVFVGNDGVIQIHSGLVEKVLPHGDWFNVMDSDFNLHINELGIAGAWVVRKPTVDGVVSSLELFNSAGDNVLLFFSKRKPGETESEAWRETLASLTKT